MTQSYINLLNQKIMANITARPQVGFLDACKLAIQKSFTFTGRIRRSEYWWAVLGFFIADLLLSWIPFVGPLLSLYISIASISLCFRRLHDTGHSGWLVGANIIVGLLGLGVVLSAIFGNISSIDALDDPSYLAEVITSSLEENATPILVGGLLLVLTGIIELIIFVFCLFDSSYEANKYGESPKYVLEEAQPAAE